MLVVVTVPQVDVRAVVLRRAGDVHGPPSVHAEQGVGDLGVDPRRVGLLLRLLLRLLRLVRGALGLNEDARDHGHLLDLGAVLGDEHTGGVAAETGEQKQGGRPGQNRPPGRFPVLDVVRAGAASGHGGALLRAGTFLRGETEPFHTTSPTSRTFGGHDRSWIG